MAEAVWRSWWWVRPVAGGVLRWMPQDVTQGCEDREMASRSGRRFHKKAMRARTSFEERRIAEEAERSASTLIVRTMSAEEGAPSVEEAPSSSASDRFEL